MARNFMSFGDAETIFSEVADKIEHLTYVGTKAAWDSMSVAERQKYRAFDFTDYDADTDTENRLTALEEDNANTPKVTESGTATSFVISSGISVTGLGYVCIGDVIPPELRRENVTITSITGEDIYTYYSAYSTAALRLPAKATEIKGCYCRNATVQGIQLTITYTVS